MSNALFHIAQPINEPVRAYEPGSTERASLKAQLCQLKQELVEIPLIIGGEEVRTGNVADVVMPHDHGHVLARYHKAGTREIDRAIEAALAARHTWSRMAWQDRMAIFLKAAELLAGPYRDLLNAATMLGQSKNAFQAEIDSACELIDFFRFNCHFATQLYASQPVSPTGTWNRSEYRPLEGFVFAVSPFNFTSIGGNLCTAPAIMGNVVLWKPSSAAVYSAYYVMRLLREAGLPEGAIQFVPGSGAQVGEPVLASEHLAGIHFTGSTAVFQSMWKSVGGNIDTYRGYPRIVGETGGKDFIFVHESADVQSTVIAMVRGAFEYQGQKCSAASRAYVPDTIWDEVRPRLLAEIGTLTMGSPEEFSHFMNAVIDQTAFRSIQRYLNDARASDEAEILCGGGCDDTTGYFIEPTVIRAHRPDFKTMVEEIFGPVLTVYVYQADQPDEALRLCDETSPYALTGAIFAQDRGFIAHATGMLQHAAGNFYINDKPTGAVVSQQPFGGGRASGTNDKAGSLWNLIRWASPRTLKETFLPPTDYRYPCMGGG